MAVTCKQTDEEARRKIQLHMNYSNTPLMFGLAVGKSIIGNILQKHLLNWRNFNVGIREFRVHFLGDAPAKFYLIVVVAVCLGEGDYHWGSKGKGEKL